ncbi:MAG: hypothetical protein PUB07_00900 [Clostridia bacterium]|nr:hypothetical protein [Clostridia bacterium]MDD6307908.1 hypothetical protein [Clostridia bacterium]
MSLKDNIWLWGQTAGSHHNANIYQLPGVNSMSPEEGAAYFGIRNMCRVKMSVDNAISLEKEIEDLPNIDKIVLSIVGAGGCPFHKEGKNDLDEVIRTAANNSKVVAGIMDDFVSEERLPIYTPEVLAKMADQLHTSLDRAIEFWTVIYERDLAANLDDEIRSRLQAFDLFTFWTWYSEHLRDLEANYQKIRELAEGKRMMMGVYMWDYGNKCPLPDELMEYQLSFVEEKYAKGEIEGIILCSNCIMDIGLSTVPIMKKWMGKLK